MALEGTTFRSSMAATDDDLRKIPDPILEPEVIQLPAVGCEVFFDLETTGLDRTSHITQIAAKCGSKTFMVYVWPEKDIQPVAEEATGITCARDTMQLFVNQQPVPYVSIQEALSSFIAFLGDGQVTLIGHNIRSFDLPVLFNAATNVSLMESLCSHIEGIVDTLKVFKTSHPGRKSYSQPSLVKDVLGKEYDTHNAMADVTALEELAHAIPANNMLAGSVTLTSVLEKREYDKNKAMCLQTLRPIIFAKALTESMAAKIAGSGLTLNDLKLAHQRNDLMPILAQPVSNGIKTKPRVTKSDKIVEKLVNYFQSLA